jgi:hypothetical protein
MESRERLKISSSICARKKWRIHCTEMIHTGRNIRADDYDDGDGEGDISLQVIRCITAKRLVFSIHLWPLICRLWSVTYTLSGSVLVFKQTTTVHTSAHVLYNHIYQWTLSIFVFLIALLHLLQTNIKYWCLVLHYIKTTLKIFQTWIKDFNKFLWSLMGCQVMWYGRNLKTSPRNLLPFSVQKDKRYLKE